MVIRRGITEKKKTTTTTAKTKPETEGFVLKGTPVGVV